METPMMFSAEWWQQPLGSWMAWNRVTIAFFIYVFGSILAMGVWEYFSPGGSPRRGIFRLDDARRPPVHDAYRNGFHLSRLAGVIRNAPVGRPRRRHDLGSCGLPLGVTGRGARLQT